MTDTAPFRFKGRNPDVLSCIANLSNDEVFTPPDFANRMLDTLTESWAADNDDANIWADSRLTFLDPCTKSGVFLREIAKRLIDGLETEIPDLQARVDHVLTRQVFGIGITELTALLARRSLYCSKDATGEHSVATEFKSEDGNVWFERTEHNWKNAKCTFCGASERTLARGEDMESHAYAFIHTDNIQGRMVEILGADMQFDVIIGNPPYQLSDGGHGASASPIYDKFVDQAKSLEPRFLSMVIPSRWLGGGKGLTKFRETMLSDKRIRKIIDFEDAKDAFPGVDLAGGICYFLWNRDNAGLCNVENVSTGSDDSSIDRSLNEFPTFVRHSAAVPIIRKVIGRTDHFMDQQVTSRKPFGLPTTTRPKKAGELTLQWEKGEGPFPIDGISKGHEIVEKWKVATSYVAYDHAGSPGKDGRRKVFSKILILPPKTVCTETYLIIGAFDSEEEARNLIAYMRTRFFRFLISQFMYSHHLTKKSYGYVPVLDMSQKWDDQKIAKIFGLSDDESLFINSKIREIETPAEM
jgi:site-specific DNA-methyltransferase (adenine-specific)